MVYTDVEVESETVDFGRRQRSNEDVRTPSPEETLEDTVASATSSPTKVRYKLLESNAILLSRFDNFGRNIFNKGFIRTAPSYSLLCIK